MNVRVAKFHVLRHFAGKGDRAIAAIVAHLPADTNPSFLDGDVLVKSNAIEELFGSFAREGNQSVERATPSVRSSNSNHELRAEAEINKTTSTVRESDQLNPQC